jgi:hypothetical protein
MSAATVYEPAVSVQDEGDGTTSYTFTAELDGQTGKVSILVGPGTDESGAARAASQGLVEGKLWLEETDEEPDLVPGGDSDPGYGGGDLGDADNDLGNAGSDPGDADNDLGDAGNEFGDANNDWDAGGAVVGDDKGDDQLDRDLPAEVID